MILVESHNLLFVHVPQTGGTAIRRYLVDELGGTEVANNHRVWEQERRRLPRAARLRILSAVRNPLDQTMASFYKALTDHAGGFSEGRHSRKRVRQWEFLQRDDQGFEAWFMAFRQRVYSPRWLGSVRRSTWVMRFERLEEDFMAALRAAGVSDPPPLPVVNRVDRPRPSPEGMYRSEPARRRAARIFGPFMEEFGYAAPAEWEWIVPRWARAEYRVAHRIRLALPGFTP